MLTLSLRATAIPARDEQFRLRSWRSVGLPSRTTSGRNDGAESIPRCFSSELPIDDLPVLEVARRLLLGKDGPTIENCIPVASRLRDLSLVEEVELRAPPSSPATSPLPVRTLANHAPARTNRQQARPARDAHHTVAEADAQRETTRKNLVGEVALTMLCERWRPGDMWDQDADVVATGINSGKRIRKVPRERETFADILCKKDKSPYVEGLEGYNLAQQCDDGMVCDHEFRYF